MAENGGHRRSSDRLKRPVEEKRKLVEEKKAAKEEQENGVPESKEEEKEGTEKSENEEPIEVARARLRNRWELASVLNFFGVFESVIGRDLKMSAEEIEEALIKPNALLAKLHVTLLKGIPPVSKNLGAQDAWITALCRKLVDWWPWVADGEIPLTVSKGEEIKRYKKLDSTTRLLMLKALCEIRVEEDDMLSYINSSAKQGEQLSSFRKDRIGDGGSRTSYWYDGHAVIGHRLYREVYKLKSKSKSKGKSSADPFINNVEWETLATNIDEFRQILEKFSSSKIGAEVAVHTLLEKDVIPTLENLEKKKEKALKRQQRQEYLLNAERTYALSVRGSTRARKPVSYTFDEYDLAIEEAIRMSKKRSAEQMNGDMHGRRRNRWSSADMNADARQSDGSMDSMDEDENPSSPMGENASDHVESNGNPPKINGRMNDSEEDANGNLDSEKENIDNDNKQMKFDYQGQTEDDNDSDGSETFSHETDDSSSEHQPAGDGRKQKRHRPTQDASSERDWSDDHTSSSGESGGEDHVVEVNDSEEE